MKKQLEYPTGFPDVSDIRKQDLHNFCRPSASLQITHPNKYLLPENWTEYLKEKEDGTFIYTIRTTEGEHTKDVSSHISFISFRFVYKCYHQWRSETAEEFYKSLIIKLK